MICYGFKGGTGTASRRLDENAGGFNVGVLVQCNYGRPPQLRIAGIPVTREMKIPQRCVERQLDPPTIDPYTGTVAPICSKQWFSRTEEQDVRDVGSIIVVVATDAPLTPDQLKRLARRVPLGLGRAGAIEMNGSGDLFLAFSTANVSADEGNSVAAVDSNVPTKTTDIDRLAIWKLDPLFAAVVQATEEAVDNALVAAETMKGPNYWIVSAIPRDQLKEILRKHNVLRE